MIIRVTGLLLTFSNMAIIIASKEAWIRLAVHYNFCFGSSFFFLLNDVKKSLEK